MGTVHVWDLRGGRKPLCTVMAHVANTIGALDWNPAVPDELVTCSPTEQTVRRWAVGPRAAERGSVRFASGAGWARYTPGGDALVTAHADNKVRVTVLASTPSAEAGLPPETIVQIPTGKPPPSPTQPAARPPRPPRRAPADRASLRRRACRQARGPRALFWARPRRRAALVECSGSRRRTRRETPRVAHRQRGPVGAPPTAVLPAAGSSRS
jgi:hypothetical protein